MKQLKFTADGKPIYQFKAGSVLADFMLSSLPVQVIMGPIGSGKSKACNLKVQSLAQQQRASPADGVRYTRWAVVRNTYPELVTTTMRTWRDTYPENIYGRILMSKPAYQHIKVHDVDMQIDFLALDKDEDIKKLRSAEYTGFYVNELQFIPWLLFDEMTSRTGRYPAMKDGGPSWHGIIADMNAPDEDHFISLMTGMSDYPENTPQEDMIEFPHEWGFFKQPPAMLVKKGPAGAIDYITNPLAENREWLPHNYYPNLIRGKKTAWIKSRVLNEVALVVDGDPVWPQFKEEMHCAASALRPVSGHVIYVGMDFGRSPAAVFGQAVNNRVAVLGELQGFNMGAVTFAPMVKRYLETHFTGYKFTVFGDPKGRDKTQTDERNAYDVFAANGIPVEAAPVKQNNILTRIEAVEAVLNELYDGRPRFLLSPTCRSLKVGMSGRYCFKKVEGADGRTHKEPDKNRYADLADALQYMVLGMGEGRKMIGLTPLHEFKAVNVNMRRKSLRRVIA